MVRQLWNDDLDAAFVISTFTIDSAAQAAYPVNVPVRRSAGNSSQNPCKWTARLNDRIDACWLGQPWWRNRRLHRQPPNNPSGNREFSELCSDVFYFLNFIFAALQTRAFKTPRPRTR